jgi:hypothetical protein
MLRQIHIYDCDGVLVDSSHRTKFKKDGTINLWHWFQNDTEENILKDTLLPYSENYKRDLNCPYTYVIICTARELRAPDFRFIRDNIGYPDRFIYKTIFTRKLDNGHFKKRELQKLFNLQQFQNLKKRFWDDNISNLYAVCELGVDCFHVQNRENTQCEKNIL